MKRLLIILLAWLAGLSSIILLSYWLYEIPGLRDVIGFGGILLAGGLVLTFLFYLPAFRALKKIQYRRQDLVLYPVVSACIANFPLYMLLWIQSGKNFGAGESFLFGFGFFVFGLVFGAAYTNSLQVKNIRKAKSPISKRTTLYFLGILFIMGIAYVAYTINFSSFRQNAGVGSVREINSMQTKRSAHTATKLNDGTILLCGGIYEAAGAEINNATAEIFDPESEKFTYTGNMHMKRAGHTATLLYNGDVLVVGGFDSSGFLNSAEIYHPKSRSFEMIHSFMTEKRAGHTATLLPNGKVLIAGGVSGAIASNSTIEFFDPAGHNFELVARFKVARTGNTATLLEDGKVLFCGGSRNWRSEVLRSCEIFDPVTNRLYFTDSLNIARNKHVAVMLKNGEVLIAGGSSFADRIGGRYNTVEIFDSKTGRFRLIEDRMNESRFKISNAADVLDNGDVIIAGDGKYVDVLENNSQMFRVPSGNLQKSWMYPTVTTLQNGKVLITGGYDNRMRTTSGAWLFERGKIATGMTQAVKY